MYLAKIWNNTLARIKCFGCKITAVIISCISMSKFNFSSLFSASKDKKIIYYLWTCLLLCFYFAFHEEMFQEPWYENWKLHLNYCNRHRIMTIYVINWLNILPYVIACYNIKIILCKHLWLRQSSFDIIFRHRSMFLPCPNKEFRKSKIESR